MFTKSSSYIKLYPTALSRAKVAGTLGSNVGIEALLGVAHRLETVGGYMVWNFLCLIAAAGAIWALLIATKTFRGDEDAGRWELLLSGQTTARKAATNALLGLYSGLTVIYVCIVIALFGMMHLNGAGYTAQTSLFFGLVLIAGAAEFLAVGALASQLMPTRSRAASFAASVFGVFYVIRLIADTTNAHWLLNVSPLGWIEKLQPMYGSQPIWLLPIAGFVLVCSGLAIYLAGRRDLGSATFADKDTAKPHYKLLNAPFYAAMRLTRAASIGWIMATVLMAFVYGSLTKGAVKAFSQSNSAQRVLSRLSTGSKTITAAEFMGITFFIIIVLIMFYGASAIGKVRSDEAQGYLDNFLVRPVSRLRWLFERVLLIVIVVVVAGLLGGMATWVGEASQHGGIAFHTIMLAGINAMTPVIFVVGIGVFAIGLKPRLTSFITYGVIGWSFLIVMLSSGLNLNHWLLDTSIMHHVTFAPAVNPNWSADLIIVIIAVVLGLIGALVFNKRDLESE